MSAQDSGERWRRQFDIFHRALELTPRERSVFVDRACGSDAELRRNVQELLAGHLLGSPLDASVGAAAKALDSDTRKLDGGFTDTLPPGTVLAGRFEISRLVGRGGMGTVYEARDRRLGTIVALKLLRDEIAEREKARARFLREINLARTVTHANACRVYDLVEDGDRVFLTMELVDGETLAERLQRLGHLSLQESMQICAQVAAALDAAHAVGVVHRDLKPSNVILVRGPGSTRAVVTDFGLATTEEPPSALDPSITRSGEILGTPAYMAPEQLEGGEITPATDVYALGLLLYEMVTGARPFEGDTPFSIASKRLHGEANSPRVHLPALDELWERVILRCLARQPADRFETPREVVEELTREGPAALRPRRRWGRKVAVWAVAAALGAVLAVLVTENAREQQTPGRPAETSAVDSSSAEPIAERDTVLVTAFDNLTQDPAWDGVLDVALARELSSSTFLTVAPRLRIVDTLRLMKLPPETVVDAELGREIAIRDGGIRALVSGQAQRLGSTYVLSARIVDPQLGTDRAFASVEATSDEEVYGAVRTLASAVREGLGETLASIRRHEDRLARVTTPSLAALRLYSEADALVGGMTFEWPVAAELLEQALLEDPNFASAHLLLARVLQVMGRDSEALPHLDRAMELADTAPERERLDIRSSYFESRGDMERASANREALLRVDPYHFWANVTQAITRSFGPDPKEGIPYQLRKARGRPNSLDANFDAGQLLAMLTNRDDEAREFFDRAVMIGEYSEATGNTYELTYARLWTAHELWLSGDVEGAHSELDRWAARLPQMAGGKAAALRAALLWSYRGLGMAERAAGADLAPADPRFLLGVQAYSRGDAEAVRRHLAGVRANDGWRIAAMSDPLRIAMLARSGFVDEADEIARAFASLPWEPTPPTVPEDQEVLFDLTRAEIALARGRAAEAADLFERRLGEYWRRAGSHVRGSIYYVSSIGLAAAWEALGEPDKALAAVERASRQRKQTHPYSHESWLRVQLELARLYREADREREARKIESELRDLMRLADPDFWLVLELDRRR